MKSFFLNYKNEIKYKDVEFETIRYVHKDGENEKIKETHTYTITGIGKKAIKYQKDHGEDEFLFYDNREFQHIAEIIAKSFENELWNKEVRACIEAQKKYCRDNKAPHFAPEDGFCWSCGKQIYADYHEHGFTDHGRNLEYASTELITGCPHCSRSYCD